MKLTEIETGIQTKFVFFCHPNETKFHNSALIAAGILCQLCLVEFELNYYFWKSVWNQVFCTAQSQHWVNKGPDMYQDPLDIAKHLIGHYWRWWHEKSELDALVSSLTSRLISHHIPIPQPHSWAYASFGWWHDILEYMRTEYELARVVKYPCMIMVRHPKHASLLTPNSSSISSRCHCSLYIIPFHFSSPELMSRMRIDKHFNNIYNPLICPTKNTPSSGI